MQNFFFHILHMQNYGKALPLGDSNWLFVKQASKLLVCNGNFDTHDRTLQPSNNVVVRRL